MESEKIHLSSTLQERPGLAKQVESQRALLASEIDLKTATAEWDYLQDAYGRDLLILHVRDPLGAEARSRFAPVELENEDHLRTRLQELVFTALRVNQWRTSIGQLYQQVYQWVQRHAPGVLFERTTMELNEDRSGPYEVPILRMTVENRPAELQPVACWVVGADGRVDLTGAGGREILIFDKNAWFWVSDRPFDRLQPLTEELFLQLFDSVLQ